LLTNAAPPAPVASAPAGRYQYPKMEKIKGKSFWEKYTLPAIGTLMGGGLVAALHYDKKSRDKAIADAREYQKRGEEKRQYILDAKAFQAERKREADALRVSRRNQGLSPLPAKAAYGPPTPGGAKLTIPTPAPQAPQITGDTNMAKFQRHEPYFKPTEAANGTTNPYDEQNYPFKVKEGVNPEAAGSAIGDFIGKVLPGTKRGGKSVFHNILAKAVPYALEEGIPGVMKPIFGENEQLKTRDELFEQAQKSLADILPLTKAQMHGQHFPGLSQFESQLDAQTDATMQQLSASGRRGNVTPEVLMSMRQELDEAKQGQVANFMLGSMQQAQQAYPKFIAYLSELSEQAGRIATEEEEYRASLAESVASLFLEGDPRLMELAEMLERGSEEDKAAVDKMFRG